ncbi:endonuclease NucS domain-containing protein [Actinocorallia libanotica]|uniref:Endonuclease NucS C-terminal domain-containing protein n=1 Tax=Actinocorallia libanotica TaxID=46162 RepID=A0ABN1QTF6_9ACTN
MPVEVGLWRVDGDVPERIRSTGIELETQLERLIEQDPDILGDPLLIIGRQVSTSTGGIIDLLAIDGEGNLHVLELKRDRTPRDVVAQVLDYGSWVASLSNQDVRDLHEAYAAGAAFDVAFSEVFGQSPPEDLNSSHHLTVVAHDADVATERIVNYLSSYAVPVNILFFRYFEDDGRRYLARSWLVSETSTVSRTAGRRRGTREEWNGQDWYVSFGEEGGHRNWDDARTYGFVSAGGGLWFSRTLRALPLGGRVFVYIPQTGYVAVGEVIGEAHAFSEAEVIIDGQQRPLRELPLQASYRHSDEDDATTAEYVVPVRWISALPREEAISASGLFANQNSACRLRNSFTIETLTKAFELDT